MFGYNESSNSNKTDIQSWSSDEAKFLGWQETEDGDIFALYNVIKPGHPLFRSTVTEKTLYARHLHIPRTPSPFPNLSSAPWHDAGTELSGLLTTKESIIASGLDYTVVKRPLHEVLKLNNPGYEKKYCATVRSDNGEVLGIVDADYVPIQNRDAFSFFDTLIGGNEAICETAGMFGRGERIWILAKLPGYIKVHGKDIVGKYLLLSNSHDGSSKVRMKLTPIRVVCNNTLSAALKTSGEVMIPHSFDTAKNMKQALSLLEQANGLYDKLDKTFHRMSLKKISDAQLLDYVKSLIPEDETEEDEDKNKEIQKAVLRLYDSGQGADLARGTLWGAFNCVTEYADYAMQGTPTVRLESNWFGRGEQLKRKAFELAERMM